MAAKPMPQPPATIVQPTIIDIAPLTLYIPPLLRFVGLVLAMPLVGDNFVRFGWRLVLAAVLTAAFAVPMEGGDIHDLPRHGLFALIEGVFIGALGRLVVTALQILGSVISNVTGLQFASLIDPGEGQQAGILDLFFLLLTLKFFVSVGLFHRLLLIPIDVFAAGSLQNLSDALSLLTEFFTRAVQLGTLVALPFVLFNLLFGIFLGIANRFMSNFPLFQISQPLQILLGILMAEIFLGTDAIYRIFDQFRSMFFAG
jgi:flagellar biosynthesis protein FliR